MVEDVRATTTEQQLSIEDFSPDFQIALPYRGVFVWHVGGDDVVGDPNQVLFVTAGEPFRVSGPRRGPYAELILTPSFPVLSEIVEMAGFNLPSHPLFRTRSSRSTSAVQRTSALLLHWGKGPEPRDALAEEEALLELLRASLQIRLKPGQPSAATRGLIRRTKEYLNSAFTRQVRLAEVAVAVGATPSYLTDIFRRFEGLSLQRYVTQLRLARALIELNRMEDLTQLALGLGFSSHSHFSLAFRRSFGCTPSAFRSAARRSRTGVVSRYSSATTSLEQTPDRQRVRSPEFPLKSRN